MSVVTRQKRRAAVTSTEAVNTRSTRLKKKSEVNEQAADKDLKHKDDISTKKIPFSEDKKIPKISLRPRNSNINYFDRSTLKSKQNSIDEIMNNEHKGKGDEKKCPIYDRINLNASQGKDEAEVYEFVPDKNDVQKNKKRTVQKAPVRETKTADKGSQKVKKTVKKTKSVTAMVADNIEKVNKVTRKIVADKKTAAKRVAQKVIESNEEAVDSRKMMDVSEPIYDQSTLLIGNKSLGVKQKDPLQVPPTSGVRIVSDVELRGEKIINITKTPLQPEANLEQFSGSFRVTNAFNPKPSREGETMMDSSLLRRSFSPISKATTLVFIEDGSPWRPLPISAFSKVRNVVQSTPMGEKLNQMPSKTALIPKRQPRTVRLNNIVENNDENANVPKKNEIASVENMKSPVKKIVSAKKNPTNNSKSPRKFGTEISNLNSPAKRRSPMSPSKLSPVDTLKSKQSNLDHFLNILGMPESARMTTTRRIFGDAHSTPIIMKKGPKLLSTELDSGNTFGFDENVDNTPQIDISPIKCTSIRQDEPVKKIIQNLKKKVFEKPRVNKQPHPARFSIAEIEKILRTTDVGFKKVERTAKAQISLSPKKAVVHAIDFRDTFDMKKEDKDVNKKVEESIKSVPLFYDLEPAHFTEPPRYSYKRKHHDKYDTSYETEDEQDENNDEEKQKHQQKKRRIGKAAKEQQKHLNAWVKNINKTFDEIENFDLVIG